MYVSFLRIWFGYSIYYRVLYFFVYNLDIQLNLDVKEIGRIDED